MADRFAVLLLFSSRDFNQMPLFHSKTNIFNLNLGSSGPSSCVIRLQKRELLRREDFTISDEDWSFVNPVQDRNLISPNTFTGNFSRFETLEDRINVSFAQTGGMVNIKAKLNVTVQNRGMDNKRVPLYRFVICAPNGDGVIVAGPLFFLLNRGTKQEYFAMLVKSMDKAFRF